ncbi:hypothetical protein I4U23_008642 [Adineta vaga]|nr:hypothetical protein I4U23_008642 [Adineta vaga]
MSLAAYSTCRIQFLTNEQRNSVRNYSDRSLVQLKQFDFADYSLLAIDIANNKEEIFNIPLKQKNLYKYGQSPNHPDEVQSENGTYLLWLNSALRTNFHEALDTCFEQISSLNNESTSVPIYQQTPSKSHPSKDPKPASRINQNDILVNIYQLGEQIRLGHDTEAVDLAKKLAEARVQLKASLWNKNQPEEKTIPIIELNRIKVKIDGNQWRNENQDEELVMNVYPSTTIRELRNAFESSHKFSPIYQHFFVNGHLAHDNFTMNDLNIHNMSIEVYSKCRIQYIPNDQKNCQRNYSENSILELINYDHRSYSLRAVDTDDNKSEIFNVPLQHDIKYTFGRSNDQPDEIRFKSGIYKFWLNQISRANFHDELTKKYNNLPRNASSDGRARDSEYNNHQTNTSLNDNLNNIDHSQNISAKDLLPHIHELGECIGQGDTDKAVGLATQLASAGVRIQVKPSNGHSHEAKMMIYVQLDGNLYSIDQHGPRIPVNVFPSTTVRELRAIFELTYQSSPNSQYIFVNGRLAHDDESMTDLHVGPQSTFVLFQLAYGKMFTENGPWSCRSCRSKNEPNSYHCEICFAERTE